MSTVQYLERIIYYDESINNIKDLGFSLISFELDTLFFKKYHIVKNPTISVLCRCPIYGTTFDSPAKMKEESFPDIRV